MPVNTDLKLSAEILERAREFGADLAGFADVASLKKSPSHQIYPQLPEYHGPGTGQKKDRRTKGDIVWPQGVETLLVIAFSQPESNPSLDHWRKPFIGGSEGNLKLIRINNRVIKWLSEHRSIKANQVPYHIEHGGIFLKDAAVLAGLGVIGKNNMLVTPQFGPRVRLRALALPFKIPSTGPMDFDPCASCDALCRRACPRKAFHQKVFSSSEYGQTELPAREGVYNRNTCKIELEKNIDEAEFISTGEKGSPMRVVSFCRICEFSCPIGGRKSPS